MPNYELFESTVSATIHPSLTAKEIAEKFVVAVLEAEYGKAFTLSPNFAKMVNTLAEIVVTNPDLRRQALALASVYLNQTRDYQKNRI